MLSFHFAKPGRANYKVLCLGAHSDDIEIGCGGSILELLRGYRNLEFHWIVFSSGGERGTPNFYVPFSRKIADRKIKFLMDCFGTQRDKRWFTRDTFQGLMRIRGVEVNAPGQFAEGFYARKLLFGN